MNHALTFGITVVLFFTGVSLAEQTWIDPADLNNPTLGFERINDQITLNLVIGIQPTSDPNTFTMYSPPAPMIADLPQQTSSIPTPSALAGGIVLLSMVGVIRRR